MGLFSKIFWALVNFGDLTTVDRSQATGGGRDAATNLPAPSPTTNSAKPHSPGMNEGDFHSGPEGYSPNTAYQDSFYGSLGESDQYDEDEWNH